jgi:predicted nucleic acid-binding protein
MRSLVDTNIIIDAMASRRPFDHAAKEILRRFAARQFECAITASTASDIYYIVKKYLRDETRTLTALKKLFALLEIVSVSKQDCLEAFDMGMRDYEDSLLAVCARNWAADCIVTRNVSDFAHSPVRAITPEKFLQKI